LYVFIFEFVLCVVPWVPPRSVDIDLRSVSGSAQSGVPSPTQFRVWFRAASFGSSLQRSVDTATQPETVKLGMPLRASSEIPLSPVWWSLWPVL
jgi:hypothetical protein